MTTPTPRTDAAEFFATTSDDAIYCVSAAFARQLERDLATAQSELASVKAERDALERVHDDIMQAVGECGSYKP